MLINDKPSENPLKFTTFRVSNISHISIKDKNICLEKCQNKPCTYYCPTRVYYWEKDKINIIYQRCVECGACPYGCPFKNIKWHYPKGGYGVIYK